MRVLLVPTRWESQPVLGRLPGAMPEPGWDVPAWRTGDLLIVEPGIGPEPTAALLPRIEPLQPRQVWLFGWCGGLTPELGVGDLVLAEATITSAGTGAPASRLPHQPPDSLVTQINRIAESLGRRMIVGPVLTSGKVLSSVEQKRDGAATGAVAVEMEAGPLARWAVACSLLFVHLRVVLDPLQLPLPPTRLPTDRQGSVTARDLLLHALTHPTEWPALWNLFHQARVARRAMADVIAALTQPGGLLDPQAAGLRN